MKEFETYVDQLLQGVEIIKAPEGSSIRSIKRTSRRLLHK